MKTLFAPGPKTVNLKPHMLTMIIPSKKPLRMIAVKFVCFLNVTLDCLLNFGRDLEITAIVNKQVALTYNPNALRLCLVSIRPSK